MKYFDLLILYWIMLVDWDKLKIVLTFNTGSTKANDISEDIIVSGWYYYYVWTYVSNCY